MAELCVTRLSIELPAVVDTFDDAVDMAYTGWPERLYLIDRDGRIAYKSKPGPFGFKPADLEAALSPHAATTQEAPLADRLRDDRLPS